MERTFILSTGDGVLADPLYSAIYTTKPCMETGGISK